MSDVNLLQMTVLAQAWLMSDMARDAAGNPDGADLAGSILRAEGAGLRLSNNTWRAAFVSASPRLALVAWLVARGIAPTRQAIADRLGADGLQAAMFLVAFGVLALAADRETLAVTVIGERCEAAFARLDQGAEHYTRHPLLDTRHVVSLALPVSRN